MTNHHKKCEGQNRLPHFFLTIALLLAVPLTILSQTVTVKAPLTPEQAEQLKKELKKDSEGLISIARQLLEQGDFEGARTFADLSEKAAKGDYPPALKLYAEIERTNQEMIGRSFALNSNFERAIDAWQNLNVSTMKPENIEEYALSCFYLGKHAEALEIALQGLKIYPKSTRLNRTAMMSSVELGLFDDAVTYGKTLFATKSNEGFFDTDYYYHGRAYDGIQQYEDAIRQYKQALNTSIDQHIINHDAIRSDLLQAIANLGAAYMEQAQAAEGSTQTQAYRKADALYAELIVLSPESIENATFMRARINAYLDPNLTDGLALPFYQKIIELITPHTKKDASDKAMLSEALRYMISYYTNIKNDPSTAKDYALKLYDLDPDNDLAQKLLGLEKKEVFPKR